MQDRTTAIALDPNSALAYVARGNAFYLLGRYDEAVADLRRAEELDPADTQTKGLEMQAEDQIRKAVATSMAKEAKPDTGAIVLPGGVATVSKPETPEVVPQTTPPPPIPVPPTPAETVAEANRVEASRLETKPMETKPAEAKPVEAKPLETKPAETEPAETKPPAKAEAKPEPKPALPEVKPSVSPVPAVPGSQASALNSHARQLANDGHFEEAIQQFTEALKMDPAMSLAYNGRGYAHFRLKRYTEAVADFDQAIKLNPAYGNAYLNRGAAKKAAGDKAGGDADLAKAREISAGK